MPEVEFSPKIEVSGVEPDDVQKTSRSLKNADIRSPVGCRNENQTPEITANRGFSEMLPHPPGLRCNFCNSMETVTAQKCSRPFGHFSDFHAKDRLKLMTQAVV
jgi:hypothetical protein